MKMTLTDFKIINYLLDNDLQNYKKMSKETRIPASTIYDRIKHLKQTGVITKMTPQLNLQTLGYNIFASLEIITHDMKGVDTLQQKLIHKPEIIGLFKMSGNYDLLALALVKNPSDLEEIINKTLLEKEVKDIHGNLAIHTYKFKQNPDAIKSE